jgi:hypothetical protein
MKFNGLPVKIKHFFSTVVKKFRGIFNLPHAGKYFILSIILTIIFIIITFPFDKIISKQLHQYEGKGLRTISVQDIKFTIFGESSIGRTFIVLNNNDEVHLQNGVIALNKNPYRLLYKKNILSDFELNGLKYSSASFNSNINLNGNADVILNPASPLPLSGIIKILVSSGAVNFNELTFQGPLGPMTLKVETINIGAINCHLEFINDAVNIKRFDLTGDDLSGSVTGSIRIAPFLPSSAINLTINIDPDSAVLNNYRDLVIPLVKNNSLTLFLSGTLRKPDVRLSPGE